MTEAIIGGLDRSARDIALMETWGTNPEAAFSDDLDHLAHNSRERPTMVDALRNQHLQFQWKEVTGETKIANNPTMAQIGSGVRAAQSLSKLGAAVFSHLTLLPLAASELRWQGESLGKAYMGFLANFLEGKGTTERRQLAMDIGVGIDGWTGALAARLAGHDEAPGVAATTMRQFFKLNTMSWIISNSQIATGRMMAQRVAQEASKGWGGIDPQLRAALQQYGFDEARWNVVRQGSQKLVDGRAYLTRDAVQALPDSAFASLGGKTARLAAKLRDDLSTALGTFYNDRIGYAVPWPGAREQAILHQGQQRGTWMGEALRFMGQFKQYPLTFATRVMGREMNGFGVRGLVKGKGDLWGLAHLIAGTTAMGMISLQCKEILKGHMPRNPLGDNWPAVWGAAFAQGGGAGIYGDFLLGEYNRYGNDLTTTALGPAAGTVNDLARILAKTGRDVVPGAERLLGTDPHDSKLENPLPDLFRTSVNNAPFVNLFYTRAALDYLVLYNLQEMVSPGYLRRMEKRLKSQNDQTFIVPPSTLIPRGGEGNAIYGQ